MRTVDKIGLGVLVLLSGAALFAMQPADPAEQAAKQTAQARLKLAAVDTSARRDVDYRQLDGRLRQLMEEPAMVGLAVGIVENGRITFLRGYGETLEGSGDPVTPQTVFRWASV